MATRAFAMGLSRCVAAATLILLTACASQMGIAPKAQLRDAASLGLNTPQPENSRGMADANPIAPDWWCGFDDPRLNALIEQALQQSPNLKLAEARIARAQSFAEVAQANRLPQLVGSLDMNRQLYTANFIYPPPLGGSIHNDATLRLNASWELDFFGKNRAALNAAIGNAQAAQADAQAARTLLAAQVARSYIQLARANDLLAVARRTLAQRQESLGLVRDRVNAGLDTRLELRQSEGDLPDTRQQIEALQEQAAIARHALAALVGQPNADIAPAGIELSAIKQIAMPNRLPADLLARRADIVAARWRVEAAGHEIGSARAQFYPNVNLMGFVGFSSLGFDRLFKSGSETWGVGPAIRLPIFEAGRLRANLRSKSADWDAAVQSYNATVIDAVRDAADQSTTLQSVLRQQSEQRAAQAAADSAYDIAVQRYRAGLVTYLTVLTSETRVLAQRRQAVDLAARALDAQVALIRALGGGYVGNPVAADQSSGPGLAAAR